VPFVAKSFVLKSEPTPPLTYSLPIALSITEGVRDITEPCVWDGVSAIDRGSTRFEAVRWIVVGLRAPPLTSRAGHSTAGESARD
jgi:hypothetical protein